MPFSAAPPLVSARWVRDHLSDPSLIILDCRWRLTDPGFGDQAYAEAHIPGSRRVDLDRDLSDSQGRYGGRHPLPQPAAFEESMRGLGVNSESRIVCYDDDSAGAARCWWALTFYGHQNVSVLDGGLAAWIDAGYPLTQKVNTNPRGTFVSRPDPRMVADYQTVRTLQNVLPVIDARAPERYAGTVEPIDARAGHIPGAVNYPYAALLSENGAFKDPESLRRIFSPVADVTDSPIVYCGSGVSACVVVLAMRHIGLNPLLYPGSWSDWIQHEDAPIG